MYVFNFLHKLSFENSFCFLSVLGCQTSFLVSKIENCFWKQKIREKNSYPTFPRFFILFSNERKDENFWVKPMHFLLQPTKNLYLQIGEKTRMETPNSKQWLNCAPNFSASYASHLPPRNMSRLLNLCCPVFPSHLFIKKREKNMSKLMLNGLWTRFCFVAQFLFFIFINLVLPSNMSRLLGIYIYIYIRLKYL